jgi:predicted small lipoprotein YifL
LLIAVVSALAAVQMVTGCGQKGDLYLPEQDPAEQSGSGSPDAQGIADDLSPESLSDAG